MGCCCSTPQKREVTAIGMSTLNMVVPPGLGEGVPDSVCTESQKLVKQTTKIEVDCLKGNTFVNQYLIIKDLGKGSFGKVKLCLNVDDNCLYALKVVSKKQMRRRLFAGKRSRTNVSDEEFLKEISVMKSLQHPNIVQLFEVIDDPSDDKLLMVMEYVEGGEVVSEEQLTTLSRRGFSEDIARRHFRDLIKGLDYLHYQNIIHRDIKPENLLLTEHGSVKLSDFGSASHIPDGNDTMLDTCGTRAFFAPEMCNGEGSPYGGKKADIYAAGVVLYVLIFLRLPFESDHPGELFEKITREEPDFSGRPDVSADVIDLLKRLLDKNPDRRLSLEQIMIHDWFTDRSSLSAIKTSKMLSIPTIDVHAAQDNSLTPSIQTVFQQIPDKRIKHFPAGVYIVREGEEMPGFYLIKKGLCVVSVDGQTEESGSSDMEGDTDFHEEELERGYMPDKTPKSHEGTVLLNVLSQPSGELAEMATQELSRFTSLNRSDLMKGVGRRTTYQHTKLKELVESAAADRSNVLSNQVSASGKSRRGPGSIIGLDLAVKHAVARQTVKVVEPVEAIFVRREALDKAFSGSESRLQLRLLVAKLQRIELLKDTVQKLADLHSDFLQMEQLRSLVRNVTVQTPDRSH